MKNIVRQNSKMNLELELMGVCPSVNKTKCDGRQEYLTSPSPDKVLANLTTQQHLCKLPHNRVYEHLRLTAYQLQASEHLENLHYHRQYVFYRVHRRRRCHAGHHFPPCFCGPFAARGQERVGPELDCSAEACRHVRTQRNCC